VAFRIPAQCVRDELILLWRREMLSGAYQPRWVTALVNGTRQRALTFVVNRRHERYVRKLSSEHRHARCGDHTPAVSNRCIA